MCFHVPISDRGDAARTGEPDVAKSGRSSWWGPLGVGAAGTVVFGYVVAHDPNQGGLVPACPFLAVTGWWCPGCGMTRATHALAHGDVDRALRLNLFVVPILAALGLLYALWVAQSFGLTRRSLGARLGSKPHLLFGIAGVLVAFAVVRNLPGFEFLIGR